MKEVLTAKEQEVLSAMEQEINRAENASYGMNPMYSSAMFGNGGKQNLVEWELDFSPELENAERLLRCDILVKDREGNSQWVINPDKDAVVFNQRGVNDILRELVMLVNKNKVLSNYDRDEIRARVKVIVNELRVYIYNNYEMYGIDNEYKMNNYSVIILALGDIIEAAYLRAMGGETHKRLNEARIVQQNEPIMPAGMPYMPMGNKKGGVAKLLPWNWGSR